MARGKDETAERQAEAQAVPKYSRELPAARRRALIEATASCLAERGLAGLSLREIARRAGVSPGLVGHHFAGKEDLVAQTYEAIGEKVARVLEEAEAAAGAAPAARLNAFVEASFRPPVLDGALLAVWIGFWSLTRTDPRIFAIHRRIYADYRAHLTALIAALAAERGFAIDARLAALSLTAMLDGLWLEWCLDPAGFSAEEARASAQAWVETLAAGRLALPPAHDPPAGAGPP